MTHTEILQDLIMRYPTLAPIKEDILAAFYALKQCYQSGGKLLVAGNGGSAADAEHIAGELMKCFCLSRPLAEDERTALLAADPKRGAALADLLAGALPTIALTGHAALSTAVMNDNAAIAVFAQQVWGFGCKGDVLLAISTSGNSENLLLATAAAHAKGMQVILLTGENGGKLAPLSDIVIKAPAKITHHVQELHLPIYHALAMMLENEFFGA